MNNFKYILTFSIACLLYVGCTNTNIKIKTPSGGDGPVVGEVGVDVVNFGERIGVEPEKLEQEQQQEFAKE